MKEENRNAAYAALNAAFAAYKRWQEGEEPDKSTFLDWVEDELEVVPELGG